MDRLVRVLGMYTSGMSRSMHPSLLAILIFAITLATYAATMPTSVSLEDAGLFQMVCYQGGLAHPPGYPLFTLACSALVVSPEIMNGNLVSALFGSLTVVVFFFLLLSITRSRIVAMSAALAYAFSATFWAQSIIIEVYSLAAFLLFLSWYALDRFAHLKREADWFLACLIFGLALSNHWPLAMLSAPALLAVVWPEIRSLLFKLTTSRFLLLTLVSFALGLTPYFYLVTRPDDVFGVFGPINSFSEFIDYVSRSSYNDDKAGATIADKLAFLGWLPLETIRQIGFPLSLLAALGAYYSFRTAPRHQAIAVLLNYLGCTFLLTLVLGFEFDQRGQALFMPYPIIAYGSLAIWLGYGLLAISSLHHSLANKVTQGALGLFIVLTIALTNLPSNNRSEDSWVEDYFTLLLHSLPEDAVLFVGGDLLSFPVGYLHYVKGLRPDISVYNWNSLTFPNRLTPVWTSKPEREQRLMQFIGESNKPIFTIETRFSPVSSYGLYEQFQLPGMDNAYLLPEAEAFLDTLSDMYDEGRIFRQQELVLAEFIFAGFTKLYIRYQQQELTSLNAEQRKRFNRLLGTFSGKMMLIEDELSRTDRTPNQAVLRDVATAAGLQMPTHIIKEQQARYFYYSARILLLDPPETEKALRQLEQSINRFPAKANLAYCLRDDLRGIENSNGCD
jgi:hypothetical protein